MLSDKQLMQMALDALDLVTDLTSYDDEVYEAIDALRARLAQPEREWQGLTDEEIKDHWITCMWKIEGTALPIPEFARAIEAKLKEKNT